MNDQPGPIVSGATTGAAERSGYKLAILSLFITSILTVGLIGIGAGLLITLEHNNSKQSTGLQSLSSSVDKKINKLSTDISNGTLSVGSAANPTFASVTVTGQTNLQNLTVGAVTATSITASTINGSPFSSAQSGTSAGINGISGSTVTLGSQTVGAYVSQLSTSSKGVSITNNGGAGSTPGIAINYGTSANTSVEGNTSITCSPGTGNLTGGGNAITLGAGGSCSAISLVNNPTIAGTITGASDGTGLALTGTPQALTTSSLLQLGNQISSGSASGTYIGVNETGTADLINLQANNISVFKADSSGNTSIAGTLTVNGSGDGTNAGILLQNSANSTTAFQILRSTGSPNPVVLSVDTQNKRLGVGTATPNNAVDVVGDVNVSGVFRINGQTVCSAGGCAAGNGSGNYIQNNTGIQTNANFSISSSDPGAVTGKIILLSGQTADAFEVQSSSSTLLDSIDSSGNLSVQSATVTGTLSVSDDTTIAGHLILDNHGGATNTFSAGNAVATGTVTLNGNDNDGTVTLSSITSNQSGVLINITFANAFAHAPHCVVSGDDAGSAQILPFCSTTTTGLTISCSVKPTGTGTYNFDYIVIGN